MFVGRGRDLSRLRGHLDDVTSSGTGRLLAVRGRRQVGKSALLTRFVAGAGVASVYMTAVKNASALDHLEDLSRAAATSPHPPQDAALFDEPPRTWADAFRRLSVSARNEPLVVVIDEYPWAVAADPGLDGRLQVAWDTELQHRPVLFVLVGSDLALMERTTSHDAPLFGRARPVVVDPLTPRDAAGVLSAADAVTAIDTYLVTGGYPRLLTAARRYEGVAALVTEAFSDPLSELVVSAQLALDAELPPDVPARAVLESIGDDSRGPAVFGAIVDRLPSADGTARSQVTRAMALMQDKRLVSVDLPAGAPPGSRLRRYRITDPYLRFWLRFVRPRLGDIERGRGDLAVAGFEQGWPSWRGRAVEPVVREALWRAAPDVAPIAGATSVSGWWDRSGSVEIDIAVLESTRVLGLGTIKWRERTPVNRSEVAAMERSAAAVPFDVGPYRIVVCPAGVASGAGVDLVWTADDVIAHT